ncbi:MAG TPA: methyltransferase domain-containing protein [Azospirillum sp.]|nr:methyltransferase domain-containing protein [Azospirillum sp.]
MKHQSPHGNVSFFWKIADALSRCFTSVRNNGIKKTMENIAVVLEDLWFDKSFGLETSRWVELDALNIQSENKDFGVLYEPTRVRAFRKMMDRIVLPKGRVFVDFGCGKGRILCAAAAYSFRRIVGVEFAPELCDICRRNIMSFKAKTRSDINIMVVEADAAEYKIKRDENVFFFSNPFQKSVMEAVMANIYSSMNVNPRNALLIIGNPEGLAPVVDAFPAFKKIMTYTYGSSSFYIYSNW